MAAQDAGLGDAAHVGDAGQLGEGGAVRDAGRVGDAAEPADAGDVGDASHAGDAGADASSPCVEDQQHGACGLNGRGHFEGGCSTSRTCVDPDACRDASLELRSCGLNDRGSQQRECASGHFGEWSACDDADECVDGDHELGACGLNGTGARDRACNSGRLTEWSSCADDTTCVDTSIEQRACGFNARGSQHRTCAEGQFGDWSECTDADVCRDGARSVEACGVNARGTRERLCVNGAFSEWSTCDDIDTCRDAEVEERACGVNGRGNEARTCEGGSWGDYGECVDSDQCKDGRQAHEACGLNGTGQREKACVTGQWTEWSECVDDSTCMNGSTERRSCGFNARGTQERTCAQGKFGDWSECVDPDVCRDDGTTTEACGINGRGKRDKLCASGAWSDASSCVDSDACADQAIEDRACGLNNRGKQARWCNFGTWTGHDACVDPDVCRDGEEQKATRYHASTVPYGSVCASELQGRTCQVGAWSSWSGDGGYAQEACAVEAPKACMDIAHGELDHRTQYEHTQVPFGSQCEAEAQTRLCDNGAFEPWTGTFTASSCTQLPPASCGAVTHGQSETRLRYATVEVPFGQVCASESQQRTCDNGMLGPWSGTFAASVCRVLEPMCGDGRAEGNEVCDDGGNGSGDGCAANCGALEPEFSCSRSASGRTSCVACSVPVFVAQGAAAPIQDGTGWDRAFPELTSALSVATARLERGECTRQVLRIAQGTYTPGKPGSRKQSFVLRTGLELYGGYAGQGDIRDPSQYLSVLSGDLAGNDTNGQNANENAYHVVVVRGSPTLSGLVIERGNSDGYAGDDDDSPDLIVNAGAGIAVVLVGEPLFEDLLVRDNNATYGAGLSVWTRNQAFAASSAGPILRNVRFAGNSAYWGGGMFVQTASPTLDRVRFERNSAVGGGALFVTSDKGASPYIDYPYGYASPSFSTVVFEENSAEYAGAVLWAASHPTLRDTIFRDNVARGRGGAVLSLQSARIVEEGSVYEGNTADRGGALAIEGEQELSGSVFTGNSANTCGAAVWDDPRRNYEPPRTIANSLFVDNYAGSEGILCSGGHTLLLNVTVADNGSATSALYASGGGLTLRNTIVWTEGTALSGADMAIRNSCVSGGVRAIDWSVDNIEGCGPAPGETPFLGTGPYPYGLVAGALAIDAGLDEYEGSRPPAVDLAGNARFIGTVDLGAYEQQ